MLGISKHKRNLMQKQQNMTKLGHEVCRIIDIRPTKSLGLILGLMHQIKLKIIIEV